MASITDYSVGSVPLADLERCREELLQIAAVSPSKVSLSAFGRLCMEIDAIVSAQSR
jgi:hypothetical protein